MSDYEPGDTMVEALRRANPVPADRAASRRSRPSAHALFADIIEQRPRRVRRRVLVIALVIVLVAADARWRSSSCGGSARRCRSRRCVTNPTACRRRGSSQSAAIPGKRVRRCGPGRGSVAAGSRLRRVRAAVGRARRCSRASREVSARRLDLPECSGDNRVERFVDSREPAGVGECIATGSGRADRRSASSRRVASRTGRSRVDEADPSRVRARRSLRGAVGADGSRSFPIANPCGRRPSTAP